MELNLSALSRSPSPRGIVHIKVLASRTFCADLRTKMSGNAPPEMLPKQCA